MRKFKKPLFIFISIIFAIVVLVIVFVSPIAKYLIEKYDEKFTGRQITIDWAYVNPFTGYIYLSNFNAYEYKSDSVFLHAKGVSASFALRKIFSKTYEITELTLNRPKGYIIQDTTYFNFNDLIEKFSPKDTVVVVNKEPVHFNILNINIKNGEFYFNERITPIHYFIKDVNIESDGKKWDSDSIFVRFSFNSGIGSGNIKGNFTINVDHNTYRLAAVADKFDLQIIGQYMKDLTNYGSFSAFLDADIKARGSFKDRTDLTLAGLLAVHDLHFGKNPKEDYLSFDRLAVAIEDVSPKKHIYSFDSISINHPCFTYERYDHLDNIQNIFGKGGSNIQNAKGEEKFNLVIELARYVKVLAQNFFQSPYKIDRFDLYKGDITFNDYSISEKFTARLYPLSITADSLDKNHKGGKIFLTSGIKPHGNLEVMMSVNPQNENDFDVTSHLKKVPVSMFNPYLITFTSFPLSRGTIEFNTNLCLRDGIITSTNHLLIIDPKIGKRLKNKEIRWIPTPLIMAIARENGNVIDYEIPITGNLKNPKFHFRDVIFDLLENILIKPVTTPYRFEVKSVETEIEKSVRIKWPMRNTLLQPSQERFLEKIADFLLKNPEASITVTPKQYALKEKEYLLFFEAKKRYFMAFHKNEWFTRDDSMEVDRMSVKDPMFVHYLNRQLSDSLLFTIQDKCGHYVDSTVINKRFNQLNQRRKDVFLSFFNKPGVKERIKFAEAENLVPYNGFSFFKIEYKGDFPKELTDAYEKIDDLNEAAPRKKYKNQRRKYSKL